VLTGDYAHASCCEIVASMVELAARPIPIIFRALLSSRIFRVDGGLWSEYRFGYGRLLKRGGSGGSIVAHVANLVLWRFVHCGAWHYSRPRPVSSLHSWRRWVVAVLLTHRTRTGGRTCGYVPKRLVPNLFWASMKEEGLLAA